MPRYPDASPHVGDLSDKVYSGLRARGSQPGSRVFPLNVGDTYLEPLCEARAEAQRTTDHQRLHNYSPVRGEPSLIAAIEAHHRGAVAAETVQVMSGATGGLSVVCATLLDPGDEVLLLSPYWPLIRGIIAARGATPVEVPLYTRLDAPGFDVEAELERAVSDRTVAVYVNTPNNPTGRILPDPALAAIGRVAARHDLWVLADEAYEQLYFTAAPPPAVWQRPDLRERTIVTHTFSKTFGLAGARVGYTHGPAAIMDAVRGAQAFLTYCASRPMQLGAAAALQRGQAWVAQARGTYAAAARATATALGVPVPEAGTFVFFDARPHMREGEDLLGLLGRCLDAGVLLTPGPACGRDFDGWARLCFTAVPPDQLERALDALRKVLADR